MIHFTLHAEINLCRVAFEEERSSTFEPVKAVPLQRIQNRFTLTTRDVIVGGGLGRTPVIGTTPALALYINRFPNALLIADS